MLVRLLLLTLITSAAIFSQRSGGFGGGRMGGGFGGGARMGGGFSGGGFIGGGGFGRGGFIGGGFGRGGFAGGGFRGFGGPRLHSPGFGFGRFGGSRYAYAPLYSTWWPSYSLFGGYYGYDALYYSGYYPPDPYPYAGGTNVTVVTAPALERAPVVVYGGPERPMRDYGATYIPPAAAAPPAASAQQPPIYLIALRDNVIWAAVQYWVEGRTLHFVTRQHERKQVPLAEVDRGFTDQLNRERGVEFRLP